MPCHPLLGYRDAALRRLAPLVALTALVVPASAAAQVPAQATTPPPPEHRADPALTTYVFRVGPVSIGPYQTFRRTDTVSPPPVAGSIVGMDVRLVDLTGVEIPQSELMLHHNVFTNGGPDDSRTDGACPHRDVRERFYGTSEELRALTLPRGYGYPTTPADRWKMIWMAMNHRHERREAYVEYRVTVDPSPGLTPVKPYWLSVVPCVTDPQYTVPGGRPPGSVHKRSKTFALPVGGRIVAVGGHLHGGAHSLVLSQPACGNRTLAVNDPTYGAPEDPLYAVHPLLHEPDPKRISWTQWSDGWAVAAGEGLKVSALYDASRPHMRVMGIAHVYLAPDAGVQPGCTAPPTGGETLGPDFSGREDPPSVLRTLAEWRGRGLAKPIRRPRGRFVRRERRATVKVNDFSFKPALLSVRKGATVRWSFRDERVHDATVVRGPRGFATQTVRYRSQRHRFTVPGEYRLNCSIHPVLMSQVVKVRDERPRRR
jgi:plastocyanin